MIKYKQLIAGLIIGLFIASAIPVGAAVQQYILYKTNYKILVNDKEYKNTDYPVLSYKGEMYIPIGEISETLGINAEFITKNKTINFKNQVTVDVRQNEQTVKTSAAPPETKTYKLGETANLNGIELTVSKLEYTSGIDKGFRVYFSIKNNSSETFKFPARFKYILSESKYEDELNSVGYEMRVEPSGNIYPGESVAGYYQYSFSRNISIKEIVCCFATNKYINKWIVNQ